MLRTKRQVTRHLTIALVSFVGASCSNASSPEQTPADEPIEYQLAVVDAGGYVDPNDPVVSEFRAALAVVEERCYKTSPERIPDMLVSIQQQLAQRGLNEGLLTILQALADPASFAHLQKVVYKLPTAVIPASSREGDCAAYLTAYVFDRTGA